MKNTVKRTNLFLIELVLNLFIFVLCAAVCVGLLIHARSLSRESTNLSGAVYAAQSAASEWQCGAISEDLGWWQGSGATLGVKYFDTSWSLLPVQADRATPDGWAYRLKLDAAATEAPGLISADLIVSGAAVGEQPGTVLYTLSTSAAKGVTAS